MYCKYLEGDLGVMMCDDVAWEHGIKAKLQWLSCGAL